MRYRELGRTGLSVSEIGFGGWGIGGTGWIGATDDESKRALHRAIDLGLTFVDTAARYGDGHSERVIGGVLRERSERVCVASKVPPKDMSPDATADQAFPGDHIREYTDAACATSVWKPSTCNSSTAGTRVGWATASGRRRSRNSRTRARSGTSGCR